MYVGARACPTELKILLFGTQFPDLYTEATGIYKDCPHRNTSIFYLHFRLPISPSRRGAAVRRPLAFFARFREYRLVPLAVVARPRLSRLLPASGSGCVSYRVFASRRSVPGPRVEEALPPWQSTRARSGSDAATRPAVARVFAIRDTAALVADRRAATRSAGGALRGPRARAVSARTQITS
jgi:hypothetical protein